MGEGIEVFGPTGNVRVGPTKRIVHTIAEIVIPPSNQQVTGYVYNDDFQYGDRFEEWITNGVPYIPSVEYSGNQLKWDWVYDFNFASVRLFVLQVTYV